MASPSSSECHICRLPLTRSTPSRHNECPFCGRTFRRVDGAKRHAKTCPSRGNRLLPPDVKRGRKLRACDACSRVKVSCDAKCPCTRCASRGLSCTYGRLCTDPTHLARSMLEGKTLAADKNHPALPFLLACTDPSVGPVDEVIITNEPENTPEQSTVWEPLHNHDNTISDTIDPRLLLLNFVGSPLSMDLDWDVMHIAPLSGMLDGLDLGGSEELQVQVSHLEADLRQIVAAEPQAQILFGTDSLKAFFTVSNFQECIRVFFQRDQLLATIIHRPTFRSNQVDPTLLLAIAVSGSIYLHCRQGGAGFASFALTLRSITEKYVFHRVEQLLGSTTRLADPQRALELCQAAYIISTLQSCVKDVKINQRLITKYHPMLVGLLRNLDIIGSRHISPESEQDWHTFAYKESCIRLVHWVFINDAWFTLFYNHPPAMTLLDMGGHLPCVDTLWNADCPASFQSLSSQENFVSDFPCLKSFVSGLLGDKWTEATVDLYERLNVKHFLVIIFAFQLIIFHHHTSVLIDSSSYILLRGLDRWNQLCGNAMNRIGSEESKSLGLVKHSTELAILLRRIIEVNNTKEGTQQKYLQRKVTYDTVALHQFIRQCT